MKLNKVTEIGKNQYELELFIEKSEFEEAVTRSYRKDAPKISIPGFRKGKAPRSYVEKYYGKAYFYEGALDELVPDLYTRAVEESKLDVVSRPEFDMTSNDENGVVVTAKVFTMPVAVVNSYKGLEAAKEAVTVTDEEIEHEIQHAREDDARVLTVDGAAENGDEAVIDFEGFLDGVAFEGGKGEKHPLKLGSNSFIPGFEEQIIGHKAGEAFDITVTFPEDYGEPTLAGKECVFKIYIHEVKRSELPELDDEFVKDISEFDTVDEYKADIKAKIEQRKQSAADRKFEEAVLDKLLENTEIDVPDCMVDDEIDSQVKDFDYRLQSQGGSLDMYFKYTGMDMAQLRDSFKDNALRTIKVRLALKAVAAAEAIEATEEEIENEYKTIASGYNIEVEKVKQAIKPENLTGDIIMRKAVELVKSNAVVIA